jgi:phage terminase small subunit
MSRPSQASLNVVPISGAPRLKAPSFLGDRERNVFEMVVGSTDPDHFRRSDEALLCRYCEAVVLSQIAMEKIYGGKPGDWVAVHDKTTRLLLSLATKLRLSPQSRSRAAMRRPGQPQQASYYDTMDTTDGIDKTA